MWLSSDRLMIIIGTLLVQCCFAHESFSSIKNSSGRSARLDAESQSIQISDSQLSNPSFSKSESKLSASENEISEKASNFVSVGDNVEMQDSSYYSSNNNASGSDSNIRVSDKGISQTETSISTASSTMADVDSSFVSTPNGTASSVSKSFSETQKSSSSSSTKSINGQFLGSDELEIDQGGLPENSLRPRNSFSHTRSLDSSSFPTGNPNIKPFSNSGFPSGFSKLPNSVVRNEIPRPGGPKSNYLRVGSFNSNSRPGEDLFAKPNFIGTEDTMKSIDISGSDESTFHKPLSSDTPLGSLSDNNLNHPNAPLFKDSFDNELSPLSSPDTLLDDEINSSTLSDLSPDTPLGSLSDSNLNHPNAPLFEDSFDNELSPLSSPDTLLDDKINSSTLSDTTIPLADNFPTSESSSPNIPLPTEEGTEEYLNISDSLDNTPTNLEESPAQPSNSLDSLINSSSLPSDIPLEVSPFEDSPITSDISNDTFSTNESPTITSADLPSSNIDFPFPQQTSQAYEEPCDSETHPPPIDSSSLFDQYDSPTFPSDTHFTEPTNQLPDVNPKNPLNTYPSFDSSFNSLYEGDTPFAPASHLESSKTQSLPSNDIHNDLPSPSFELQQPHDLLPGSPNIDEFIIPQDNVGYPNSPDASHDSILSESPSNELPNDFLISELESKPISESINSLDANRDDFISPEEILKANDQPPLPTLHSSPVNKHSKNSDHLPSSRPRYDGHKNFPKKNKFWKPSRGSKQSVSSNQLPPYAYFNSNYPGFVYPAYSHLPPQFNNSPSRNSPLFPAHYPLPLHPNGHPPFVRPSSYDFDRFYAFNTPTSHYQKHYNNPSSYLDMPYGPSLTQLSQKPTPYYFQNPIESPPQLHQQSIFDTKIASTPFEPDQEKFPYRNSPPSGVPIMINSMPDSSNAYLFGQPEIFSSVPQLLSSPPYKPKKWPLHSPLQSKPESYGLNTTPILPQQSSSLIDLEASNYSPLPTPLDMESLSQSPSLDSATPNTNLLMNSSSSQLPSLDSSPRLDSPTSYPFVKDSQVPYLNLPPSVPLSNSPDDFSDLFNGSKRRYEIANSEYLLSNSMYPKDISNTLDVITDEELKYNIVIVGSSPAIMAALKPLLDLGKRILVVERGTLPPLISKSLYYRPKMMQSDYVRKIKASAPHCDVEKIIYAPNVLGEESTYDSNIWDYGVKSKYIKWGKLCKKWTWSKILSYFPDDNDQLTCPIPTSLNIEDTKAINVVTDIFSDAGLSRIEYVKGKRTGGLTVLPSLRENGENIILARKTFENLVGYSNIQLALNTIADNIIFDNTGKAVGINVRTSTGIIKTISVLDELIIGTNPIDTVQLLYQSGIGDYEKLQNLNIPAQINLPYVGKEFLVTPLYFGVFYQFPQGTLLSDWESDLASMEYLFGTYQLPSALAPDYYKAFLNIYESREANVILNFRVFSKSMSERLSSYIERLKYIDEGIKDYLMNLCQNYDLLLVVPQLTNVLSRGEILFNKSDYAAELEPIIDTGMYKSKRDITIMQKAIKVLKSLAETETFRSLNGTAVQIPVKQCGEPDFSTEYNRCSIRYLSLANLHYSGGTIMGVNPFTSVVNENCIVHGTKNLRIFSSSVVPYGTSTDSSAVSALIGTYAAKILTQKYQT